VERGGCGKGDEKEEEERSSGGVCRRRGWERGVEVERGGAGGRGRVWGSRGMRKGGGKTKREGVAEVGGSAWEGSAKRNRWGEREGRVWG